MHLFHEAQQQLRAAMSDGNGRLLPGARVVQVGDLGGYKHGPGEFAAAATTDSLVLYAVTHTVCLQLGSYPYVPPTKQPPNHGLVHAGTRACFQVALDFLSTFDAPFSLITGNHGARSER
jgi:hypothetical protein